MFMVLSYDHSHCESSPGLFDKYKLNAGWRVTLKAKLTWAVSLPLVCYHPDPALPYY